eukprot:gnl/TRDRNA2_/TRDRNA2_137815_c1_seq1.p1 gnl/TRDRNA2_/TRDRNA2_137815_c1~~gnl/TRDRNA2_/TRDRNA2_137815_c1_seq1.p1  ORF type:complete len:309 (+),score=46.02 gnl/TRDRNA2_/TRDRNA2_137815_c1_seq1:62-928(+)
MHGSPPHARSDLHSSDRLDFERGGRRVGPKPYRVLQGERKGSSVQGSPEVSDAPLAFGLIPPASRDDGPRQRQRKSSYDRLDSEEALHAPEVSENLRLPDARSFSSLESTRDATRIPSECASIPEGELRQQHAELFASISEAEEKLRKAKQLQRVERQAVVSEAEARLQQVQSQLHQLQEGSFESTAASGAEAKLQQVEQRVRQLQEDSFAATRAASPRRPSIATDESRFSDTSVARHRQPHKVKHQAEITEAEARLRQAQLRVLQLQEDSFTATGCSSLAPKFSSTG